MANSCETCLRIAARREGCKSRDPMSICASSWRPQKRATVWRTDWASRYLGGLWCSILDALGGTRDHQRIFQGGSMTVDTPAGTGRDGDADGDSEGGVGEGDGVDIAWRCCRER